MLEEVKWNCPNTSRECRWILEKEKIYRFLLGLNKDVDEVLGEIVSIKPLPGFRACFL